MKWFCVLLLVLLTASCKQESPAPPIQTIPPTPAPVSEVVPEIRTSELALSFTAPISTTTTRDVTFTTRGLMIAPEKQSAELVSEKYPVTLAAPTPFLALAAKWTSVISPDAKLTVSVRASANDTDWSEWQLSSLDGDPRTQAGLFFFPPQSQTIQFRVAIERDANHQSPLLQSLKFRFISPGATPTSEQNRLAKSSRLSRNDWHCPETKFQAKAQAAPIRHLIVHHTATANDATDWPAVVRTIWNFHAVTNGWRDVGYHYLIDPNGVIYEGRAGGDRVAGIHFSCANTGTIGIAMIGNFRSTAPSKAALGSLIFLLAEKCRQFNLAPMGTSWHASTHLKLPHIAGHFDANNSPALTVCKGTHCPGEKLYAVLPDIRKAVLENIN